MSKINWKKFPERKPTKCGPYLVACHIIGLNTKIWVRRVTTARWMGETNPWVFHEFFTTVEVTVEAWCEIPKYPDISEMHPTNPKTRNENCDHIWVDKDKPSKPYMESEWECLYCTATRYKEKPGTNWVQIFP
jgi:hypothetical protein